MVKQAGGSLFTDDFLEHSDLPQFHWSLFNPDEAEGVAALLSSKSAAALPPEITVSTKNT
jgi:hypothetical protein